MLYRARLFDCSTRLRWRGLPSCFAAVVLACCAHPAAEWPGDEPTPLEPLCYDQLPAPAADLARGLEAAWTRSPETHFTRADLYRLRPAAGPAAPPDSTLFTITE